MSSAKEAKLFNILTRMPDAAMPDSDSSETNLVIVTRRDRCVTFCKIYWRIVVILVTPLLLLPVACIGHNDAYKCFYAFLVTITYWVTDAMHPSVAALIPIAVSSAMGSSGFIGEIYVRNELLDCIGIMLIILGIEQSHLPRRMALKSLLIFGCSHYRLSFILFFTTMFLSMWISGTIACGLMLPLVKAILTQLEKMGILEVYQTIGKAKRNSVRHGESNGRPSDFTVFYFLGIAYSSSIGSMATIIGSQTNQIFKVYCETLFPAGPKIEFPQFMLLNLPGVLVLETIMYFWMNFYFLGMCRARTDISLDIGMSEEEALYINTLLAAQLNQMRKITFHESVIITIILLTAMMQATISYVYIDQKSLGRFHNHYRVSSPCLLCAVCLFIMPRDLTFLKFFKKRSEEYREPLPSPSKPCLNWQVVRHHFNWSVLFIVGGSAAIVDALRDSKMTEEFENFLFLCASWPSAALMLLIIIFTKCLSEFAPSSCVAYSMLPHIARLGVRCGINPHHLMMAASLSCSLSCHLAAGSPANAMVAAYVHIPPWTMMRAGGGVTVASVCAAWFTSVAWAAAVWSESRARPHWAQAQAHTDTALGSTRLQRH